MNTIEEEKEKRENDEPRPVYLVGIGGIGMSALARYFRATGCAVAGYDRTPSPLTLEMSREGIDITHEDDEREIAGIFRSPGRPLVIYTPAIPPGNRVLSFFRENGHALHKRSEVLGMIAGTKKAICVAGTHGKTTVSTMTAFLLHSSRVGCNAFLGGISSNFGTNVLVNPASPFAVIEADEYDRSFLHLHPEMAVITSTDADHLDVYGTRECMMEAFEQFACQTRGKLFARKGVTLRRREVDGYYAVDEPADYRAARPRPEGNGFRFDYAGRDVSIPGLRLAVPGRVNVENVTAAITLALHAGVSPGEIREALPRFKGVARRFDLHANGRAIYVDDYAHHPREIEATLTSAREMWPGRRLTVAFQPHLYSRTRDFYPGFAKSLSLADEVILMEIYPAREEPLPGVTSRLIADRLTVPHVMARREELPELVRARVTDGIFMTIGAGDIDRFVPLFTAMFTGN
ncbi:MAG: UDP-N-acetylmuramate--L-alanine ligase [Odoribacteraceae bacterium]|jgi:UDP-N-acetylmuramate--alanine ligase|nr:UDP-N-acetylmuramate--L-alanine ligase [Odoribacteraceae bacterium]